MVARPTRPGKCRVARCEIKLHTLWRRMRLHDAQPKDPNPARSVGRGSIRLARMAKQRKKFDEIYLQLKCRQVQRASRALGQPKGLESATCACSTCVWVCVSVCLTRSYLLAEWVYLKFNYAAHAPLNNSTKNQVGKEMWLRKQSTARYPVGNLN